LEAGCETQIIARCTLGIVESAENNRAQTLLLIGGEGKPLEAADEPTLVVALAEVERVSLEVSGGPIDQLRIARGEPGKPLVGNELKHGRVETVKRVAGCLPYFEADRSLVTMLKSLVNLPVEHLVGFGVAADDFMFVHGSRE